MNGGFGATTTAKWNLPGENSMHRIYFLPFLSSQHPPLPPHFALSFDGTSIHIDIIRYGLLERTYRRLQRVEPSSECYTYKSIAFVCSSRCTSLAHSSTDFCVFRMWDSLSLALLFLMKINFFINYNFSFSLTVNISSQSWQRNESQNTARRRLSYGSRSEWAAPRCACKNSYEISSQARRAKGERKKCETSEPAKKWTA